VFRSCVGCVVVDAVVIIIVVVVVVSVAIVEHQLNQTKCRNKTAPKYVGDFLKVLICGCLTVRFEQSDIF
jgi:hypothetical protein